jgi:hypothetical protein
LFAGRMSGGMKKCQHYAPIQLERLWPLIWLTG